MTFEEMRRHIDTFKLWEGDAESYNIAADHLARSLTADLWSTDIDAAPLDRKVLVCRADGEYFVAVKSDSMRNAFCYGINRGAYLMVLRVVKWREIPE